MPIAITQEKPNTHDAIQLIDELEASLAPYYPSESRHGYSVEELLSESVLFFVARKENDAVGCGGVQFFGTEYAELKRMYVRPDFRGLGIGKGIVNHLVEVTRQHEISILRLETGIHQVAAIGLYEQLGFQRIPPFGAYKADPLSLCYEKHLS